MAKRDRYIFKSGRPLKNLKYIISIIILSIAVLIFRLVYLQVFKANYFSYLAKKNIIRLLPLIAPRGDIITSDGIFYAKNTPSFSVYLFKTKELKEKDILELAKILKIDKNKLKQKLKETPIFTSILIKNGLTRKDIFKLLFEENISPFISIGISPKRVYPGHAEKFANIVGYITEVSIDDLKSDPSLRVGDYIGRKGIEKKYDHVLRGIRGLKEVEVTSRGIIVKTISETPPIKGKTLALTINSKLQSYIYDLFKQKHLKGAAVVMRPNGAILALVDSDTFNPNYFVNGLSPKQWKLLKKKHLLNLFDIATQGAYPPGSLIKPFIALGALKEGIITPKTVLFCPYSIKIGKYTYRDWKPGGFGRINLFRAIESSSDVFFYQLGSKLGIDKIDYYLSKFGFGQSPKLFSYCTGGTLPSKQWKKQKYNKGWYVGDTITTAIGQGFFLASPLQIATAFDVIANDGFGYQPFLIKNAKKKLLYVFESKYYKDIKKALWLVVNGARGTAHKARIKGLDMCGKTGTSQVVTSKVYKKIKKLLKEHKIKEEKAIRYFPHAWFASFAPMRKPQVIVVVFLFHGEHSSNAAAFAKLIYEKLLDLKLLNGFTDLKYRKIHRDDKKSNNTA